MSKLEDMEELIFKVKNKNFRPVLQEIISCYYAGAYRACIVLSFNVLVDDLTEKIRHLKDTNSDLKTIYLEIQRKNSSAEPIENYLIESLKGKNIIDNLDNEIYKMFQKLRHKSAHPTGFSPSAECARYVFSEIIYRFLSKPTLKTTSRIDELIEAISDDFFFPSNKISDMATIAKKEINDISHSAYPQLINRLYKKYSKTEDISKKAYLNFILAITRIENDELNNLVFKLIIETHSSSSSNSLLLISLLSCNATIFSNIDKATASRIFYKIKKSIDKNNMNIYNSLYFSNPFFGMVEVLNNNNKELGEIIFNNLDLFFTSSGSLLFFIKKITMSKEKSLLGWDSYLALYSKIIEKINKNEIDVIVDSIKISGNGMYSRMSAKRLICIIGGIIESYGNDSVNISEFLISIHENNKDIVEKINKYTSDKDMTMEKLLKNSPNVSDKTFILMNLILGINIPNTSDEQ